MSSENEVRGNRRYCGKPIEIYKRMKRDRYKCSKLPVSLTVNVSEDLNIARFADLYHEIKEKEIDDLTDALKNASHQNRLEDIPKCIKNLYQIIIMYPKLSGYLKRDLLLTVVELLKDEQNPKLQSEAATILQYVFTHSRNGNMVMEDNTSKIVVSLICSVHSDVQVQALKLLHAITLADPCPEINAILEEAIQPLTYLLTNVSTNDEVLYCGSKALEVACQVYPKLPHEKLEAVLYALKKLLEHHSLDIRSSACLGFGYLCDGRKEMIVEDEYIKVFVCHLTKLIRVSRIPETDENAVAGHTALGNIVRWDNGAFTEVALYPNDAHAAVQLKKKIGIIPYSTLHKSSSFLPC